MNERNSLHAGAIDGALWPSSICSIRPQARDEAGHEISGSSPISPRAEQIQTTSRRNRNQAGYNMADANWNFDYDRVLGKSARGSAGDWGQLMKSAWKRFLNAETKYDRRLQTSALVTITILVFAALS